MRQALAGLAGVSAVEMRFTDGEFDVTFDPAKTNTDAMLAVVEKKGFEASTK